MYVEKTGNISLNLEKLLKTGNELGQLIHENAQGLEEIAVADILDFTQDYLQDENVCGEVYTLSLSNATALTDFDADFFSAAGVDIEGDVSYGSGTITLRESFESAKITFAANHKTLELTLQNYTKPIPPIAYAFHRVGLTASISEILASAGIVSSYNNTIVSDEALVSIDGHTLTTLSFFDEVTLTLTLEDESTVTVLLGNPEFIPANTPVQSEAGSFVPGTDLAPGAELKVEEAEENQAVTEQAKAELGEDAQVLFYDISILDAEGNEIETGASVTLNLDIPLDIQDGEFAKVTGFVYHVTDKGIVPLDATFTLDGKGIASVTFSTDGFSLFGIAYTVEFVTGGVAWSWPGQGSYKIADILDEIGVIGTIQSVSLARIVDVSGAQNALYLSDDHTALVSDVAFQDTFELSVTVDGKDYLIVVTDDIAYTVSIDIDPTTIFPDKLYIVFEQQQPYSGWGGSLAHAYAFAEVTSSTSSITVSEFELKDTGGVKTTYNSDYPISIYFGTGPSWNNYVLDIGTVSATNNGTILYTTTINGKSITYDTTSTPVSITIGDVGPVSYSAHIDFYDEWNDTANTTTNLVSGYTLEATVGTDTYTATISETGNLTFTKDGTDYTELPDAVTSWTFKYNGTPLTVPVMLGDYKVTNANPDANGSNVYVFEAHKPNTYTASLTFKDASSVVDQSPTLAANNFYLVVNDAIYAPVNATGLGTWVGVTDNKLPEITSFKFVQNTGTVSTVDDVKNLDAVSKLGDYEILTTSVPAPDSTTHN